MGKVTDMNNSIIYTNDNCIGCNKCISVCSAVGACISKMENDKPRIEVDGARCVVCGSCIDVCVHNAREYVDDTNRFFNDLEKGENISILIAPAFKANYPGQYEKILGGLKALGVNRMINVSFGADITTWGYLNYIQKNNFVGGISQPCPAVVSYIEKYIPELIPKLFPVQSPLMCAATYARNEMGITDKFAFISPCIAKKMEIDDPNNAGLVQYNVTFEHLVKYMKEKNVTGEFSGDEIEYGLGSFYPAPGGLAENVKWFLGSSVFIRQMEGERRLYDWLHKNEDRIKYNETPFLFIDALNCENGCICGTAVNPEKSKTDDALYEILKIREESKKEQTGDAWSIPDTPEERFANYNKQFENLKLEDYLREYTNLSSICKYKIPTEEEAEEIYISMNKKTEESRHIDCTCCGYSKCSEMVMAIHNGFNRKENCIYYEKSMVQNLTVKSSIDLLTGVLNKISFEEATKQCLSDKQMFEQCAMLIFDFDDFKNVNDNYGHKTGDDVLKFFGELLRNSFRSGDIIGRIGGDEFMVLFNGDITEAGLDARCERINQMLAETQIGEAKGFSCSIGVLMGINGTKNANDFIELYELTDDALYEAKARGKARHIKWYAKNFEPPEKDMIVIVSDNEERKAKIIKKYGDGFIYHSVTDAQSALNEISLYKNYIKHIYMDYSMPDITETIIKEYIRTRPIFDSIEVNEISF